MISRWYYRFYGYKDIRVCDEWFGKSYNFLQMGFLIMDIRII